MYAMTDSGSRIIKKDMTFVKNEIQNLKSAKVNDINNTKIEIQKKK